MLTLVGKSVGDNWEEWRGTCTTSTTRAGRRESGSSLLAGEAPRGSGGKGEDEGEPTRAPDRPHQRRLSAAGEGASGWGRNRVGIVQGPAESACGLQLGPIPSSLLPAGTGRPSTRGPQELRVALPPVPGGAADRPAAAILEELRASTRTGAAARLSFLPAAIVGYTLERRSAPSRGPPNAYGLLAERRRWSSRHRPQRAGGERRGRRHRPRVAQAAALAPGVSRNGVTLAAARWAPFSRDQANCSRHDRAAIIVGATGLRAPA